MQQKYLHPVAGSVLIHRVFLWVDLGLRQKGGKKRKEKIQKKITVAREKSKIENKKEQKTRNQQEVIVLILFKRWQKEKQRQRTKSIINTESQERHKSATRSKKFNVSSVNILSCAAARRPFFNTSFTRYRSDGLFGFRGWRKNQCGGIRN